MSAAADAWDECWACGHDRSDHIPSACIAIPYPTRCPCRGFREQGDA